MQASLPVFEMVMFWGAERLKALNLKFSFFQEEKKQISFSVKWHFRFRDFYVKLQSDPGTFHQSVRMNMA